MRRRVAVSSRGMNRRIPARRLGPPIRTPASISIAGAGRLALAAALLSLPLRTLSAQAATVADLGWLVGCWEMSRGSLQTVERWQSPVDGVMTGDSRTRVGGVERESESLRLFARGDTLIYEATPSRQSRTEFRLIAASPTEVTFANPANDFPQRIVYRRVGADSIVARIEGDAAGRRQPVSFGFRKLACPPAKDGSPAGGAARRR